MIDAVRNCFNLQNEKNLARTENVSKVILVASLALLGVTLAFNPFGYAAMAFLAVAVVDATLLGFVNMVKMQKKFDELKQIA